MLRIMFLSAPLVLMLALASAQTSLAQDSTTQSNTASSLLSQGIHALHAGNSSKAEQLLSDATSLAPRDPRGYYFQAIALRRQGRSSMADGVMQQGAMIEVQHGGSSYAINQSLERIQGSDRLAIEAARRDARVEYARSRQAIQEQRYAERDARQMLAQRQPGRLPLAAYSKPVSLDQARLIASDHTDPFADDTEAVASAPAPTAPAATNAADFFAADESPKPVPAAAPNPFAAAPVAETSPDTAVASNDAVSTDVPEAARGSLKIGSVFGIFSNAAGNTANDLSGGMTREAGSAMGMGQSPAIADSEQPLPAWRLLLMSMRPPGSGGPAAGMRPGRDLGPPPAGFDESGFEMEEGEVEQGEGADPFAADDPGASPFGEPVAEPAPVVAPGRNRSMPSGGRGSGGRTLGRQPTANPDANMEEEPASEGEPMDESDPFDQ